METKRLFIMVVSVIVLVVSIVLIVRTIWPSGPRYNPSLDECLGAKMGDATAKLLHGQGDVVVISTAGGPADNAVGRAQMKGLRSVLDQHPGVKVIGVESPTNEQEVPAPGGLTPPLVERVLAKYPGAKALVSFLGVPVLRGPLGEIDAAKLPAVVALSLGEVERWQELVSSGVPSAVIRNRNQLQQAMRVISDNCDDYIVVSHSDGE